MGISAPAPLDDRHRIEEFRCSQPTLNKWLLERARRSEEAGGARTFVVCETAGDGLTVVGYYCLAAGSVAHAAVSGSVRRNMPDPIPAAILGRLAVDERYERQTIGDGLLKDATVRCINIGREIGLRVLVCHAIDERAKAFYVNRGFVQSPIEELTVMLPLTALVREVGQVAG